MATSQQVSSLLSRMAGVYKEPSRVSRDISDLLTAPQGRHVRAGSSSLVQNDGTYLASVLNLTGTLPMVYAGTTYHIPIEIFIPPKYPIAAPIVFVRPVPTMVIKDRHPHVSMDGSVHIPYLTTAWSPQYGNLIECCASMSSLFGMNPPLFSRPVVNATPISSAAGTSSTYTTGTTATIEPIGQVISRESKEHDIAREVEEANVAVQAARLAEQEEEKQRLHIQQLQSRLAIKIQTVLQDYMHRIKGCMVQEVQLQQELETSKNYLQQHQLEYLKIQRNTLQQYDVEISDSLQKMQEYITTLEEEERKQKEWEETNGINVDTLAVPADSYSKQLLLLTAKNHALSDTFYYLDKTLEAGAISLDRHLKVVRQLARRQFYIRAQLLQLKQGKAS